MIDLFAGDNVPFTDAAGATFELRTLTDLLSKLEKLEAADVFSSKIRASGEALDACGVIDSKINATAEAIKARAVLKQNFKLELR